MTEAAKLKLTHETAIPAARSRSAAAAVAAPVALRWLSVIVAAGTLLIPLVMSLTGQDPFRYPKELALRAEVILLVMALAAGWGFTRAGLPRIPWRERWLLLVAAIAAWTVLCALVSTNRLVSLPPAVRVLEYALLFVVTVVTMRGRPAWMAGLLVPPAIVNAVVYLLQEFEVWSPFKTSVELGTHIARTALLGNPNEVGSYLVAPAVVAAALALSQKRWRAAAWGAAAALLVTAIVATHTLGAILAIVATLPVMLALRLRSWRTTLIAVAAMIALAVVVAAKYQPLRDRTATMRTAWAKRDYETLSSSRVIPFFTALQMTRDRPLTGVGPGCFAYHFFDYKVRAQSEHRWMFGPGITVENYGEVHNDHLQVLSETGLPGYALFLAALVLLARPSLRRQAADAGDAARGRREFVRLTALPLAVSMAVLALAQFPLEVVASAHAYLWAAAMVVAWKDS
ncbi:MAG TPA: O-antigen ligase family protein [Thermoanaerobaculia bacterium]